MNRDVEARMLQSLEELESGVGWGWEGVGNKAEK